VSRPDVSLVLVDFDDTLVNTAPRFLGARRRLFERLVALGFDDAHCRLVHQERVDPGLMKQYGFGPNRLEHSFRETYRAVCGDSGVEPRREVEAELETLGRAVAGTPPLLDGALDALAQLAAALPTVLYTQSGDPQYQLGCVREAGVLDIVGAERVHVSPKKTEQAFRHVLDHYGVADPALVWMVGNSMRSDVNPALAVGARAILVDVPEPWEFDIVEPISPHFLRVGSFPEAVRYLLGSGQAGG
jgi:putative hydrolase of the HAD superfamily